MFAIDGYKTIDVCFEPDRAIVTTILEPIQEMLCHRCEHPLDSALSRYHLRIKDLPIMTYENFISFFRRKGFCPICKKVRAEKVHFLSENEARKLLRKLLPKAKISKLLDGKYRFIFLKKAKRRSEEEAQHIETVVKENKLFLSMELIKAWNSSKKKCSRFSTQSLLKKLRRYSQKLDSGFLNSESHHSKL